MKNNAKSLDLLNSEGSILTAHKVITGFILMDEYRELIAELDEFGMYEFITGKKIIVDSRGTSFNYPEWDNGMKPSTETIARFIGTLKSFESC